MDNQDTRGQEMVRYDMTETAMSPETLTRQLTLLQQVMRRVMQEGEHYGIIPGCQKPSLLKPGAEKLSMTFRLSPAYEIVQVNGDYGHREYQVICTLTHIPTGQVFGQGVGVCSTMESQYRYRGGEKIPTGRPVPQEYWNTRDVNLIGGPGYGTAKVGNAWQVVRIGEKMENPDIANEYNTVLKMAKKRAHVDAVLTATAASDIFTQDMEDRKEPPEGPAERLPISEPQKRAPAKPASGEQITSTFFVRDVASKDGETKGKAWTVYHIVADDGAGTKYGTFSKTLGDLALTAMQEHLEVRATYTPGNQGNNIVTLELLEEA